MQNILKLNYFLLVFLFLTITASTAKAHGERTDANGCHNCRTGACAGTYHCHNSPVIINPIPVLTQPQTTQQVQPTLNTLQPTSQSVQPKINENNQKDQKTNDTSSAIKSFGLFLVLLSVSLISVLIAFIYSIFNK
jgi:hypothetical protein